MTTGDELAGRLGHRAIAAVLTPRTEDSRIAVGALEAYAAAVSKTVDGVCVAAHTGRGARLSPEEHHLVLDTFRGAGGGLVVAGVGVDADGAGETFERQVEAVVGRAVAAAEGGADAVMVRPLPAFADSDGRHARVLRLHEEVGRRSGLPVIAFLLYPAAGGCDYGLSLLAELASLPCVAGVKVATLDRAVQCQDAIAAVRARGALAITGEDRMLGPSFTWGADASLLGITAALPQLSTEVSRSWFAGDASGFLSASQALDRFAAVTFCDPMDAYIQRMLWAAEWQGVLPREATYDPWSPALPTGAKEDLWRHLDAMAPHLRSTAL
jgi:4-hydroxy-tetrahydrodipicolinate synthase